MVFIATNDFIKLKVNELYDNFRTYNPFELCEALNIYVIKLKLGNIKGFYFKFLICKFIFLNDNLNEYEERFYLAHELGHVELHSGLSLLKVIAVNRIKFRGKETEANIFATDLLLNYYKEKEDFSYSFLTLSMISKLTGIPHNVIKVYHERNLFSIVNDAQNDFDL